MIDWSKPVQTRDGRPVEIKFTDGRGDFPVAGYVGSGKGLITWGLDGKYGDRPWSETDLVNVPEPPQKIAKFCININDSYYHHDRYDDTTHIVTIYRQPDGSVTTEVELCKPE